MMSIAGIEVDAAAFERQQRKARYKCWLYFFVDASKNSLRVHAKGLYLQNRDICSFVGIRLWRVLM